MGPKKPETAVVGFSRREFLLTVGAAPTISLMEGEPSGALRPVPQPQAGDVDRKFTPIDLSAYFNASSQEFGTREKAMLIGGESAKDSLIRVPGGKRDMQGIPFLLGPANVQSKGWIVLSTNSGSTASARVDIPVGQKAHYLCLVSFCDFDPNEDPAPGTRTCFNRWVSVLNVTLIYDDDATHVLPIRRRFETNAVVEAWGILVLPRCRRERCGPQAD